MPLLIQAPGMRVEMLAVTWEAPSSGLVEKYTVKLKHIPGTSQDVMVSSQRRAQFTGLIAGKQYTVVVAAVSGVLGSGGQKSEDAEGQFYTSKSTEQFHKRQNNWLEVMFVSKKCECLPKKSSW